MRTRLSQSLGQTVLEYSIFLGIVAVVAVTMAPMLRRSVQSVIKTTTDQIGHQEDAEQNFGTGSGHLINQTVNSQASSTKEMRQHSGYEVQYIYNDVVESVIKTESNLGFTEEN